jgi:hypothetical protein
LSSVACGSRHPEYSDCNASIWPSNGKVVWVSSEKLRICQRTPCGALAKHPAPNGDAAAQAASRQMTILCRRHQATAHAIKLPIPKERTGKELHIGPSSLLRSGFKNKNSAARQHRAHKCARTDDSQIGVKNEAWIRRTDLQPGDNSGGGAYSAREMAEASAESTRTIQLGGTIASAKGRFGG